MLEIHEPIVPEPEYIKNPDENWNLRPDVAGYEYPEDGCNWRIGVLRDVVTSPSQLAAINEILNTPFTDRLSRNMARLVITKDVLTNRPKELEDLLPNLEVLIALKDSGNEALSDCYQAIFSRNDKKRVTSSPVIAREITDVMRVFNEGKAKRVSGTPVTIPDGITIQRLNEETPDAIKTQFVEHISEAFADEDNDVSDLVEDEDSVVLVATTMQNDKPTIVGSVYASKDADVVKRNGQNTMLNGYEVSGAKIIKTMERKGIYKALSQELMHELAKRDDVDLVFGYSNAENLGVFSVAAQMGRTCVIETARELGLSIRPAMQQTITDGKLVDEVVTYMPGNQLREQYL
jgi:hypothetical protein